MSLRVSLVINTLNEADNIAACISSARCLADEVVVADMGSADGTAELARSMGALVYIIPRAPFVDPVRNQAIALGSGDWVMVLDADERLTPALCSRLREVAESDSADVVEISFETHMFGRIIRYCGWQDTSRKTFFKKGFLEYPGTEVHAHPSWKGRLLKLDRSEGEIIHFNYRDIGNFLEKLGRYTDGEALKLSREGKGLYLPRGLYWGSRQFFMRFFLRQGYRDGYYGLLLCLLMGYYWFVSFAKAGRLSAEQRSDGNRASERGLKI